MIHEKENRGHQMSKIVKSRQSYSYGHLPYHCSFHYLARASMHDVAWEFARAVNQDAQKQLARASLSSLWKTQCWIKVFALYSSQPGITRVKTENEDIS